MSEKRRSIFTTCCLWKNLIPSQFDPTLYGYSRRGQWPEGLLERRHSSLPVNWIVLKTGQGRKTVVPQGTCSNTRSGVFCYTCFWFCDECVPDHQKSLYFTVCLSSSIIVRVHVRSHAKEIYVDIDVKRGRLKYRCRDLCRLAGANLQSWECGMKTAISLPATATPFTTLMKGPPDSARPDRRTSREL